MKLLVLDIDETLVHAREIPLDREADFKTSLYHVYKRPYVDEFLQYCREHFKVSIWTTGGSDYARQVVEALFGGDYPLEFLWASERCTRKYDAERQQPYVIKNLHKLRKKGYRLEQVIMVDDTPGKLEKNYGNLVAVTEWTGDPGDRELLHLIQYLRVLKDVENIRTVEKRNWQAEYNI
ncbi:MAG: HAD family hydrolase [candidate division KSB1 bacterium]|nr:HAD family hydrolase [candidate division KSB1 bacterium]